MVTFPKGHNWPYIPLLRNGRKRSQALKWENITFAKDTSSTSIKLLNIMLCKLYIFIHLGNIYVPYRYTLIIV